MRVHDAFLHPRSVAIVGASADPTKTPGRPVSFLRRHGFRGDIWPVNPKWSHIQELPAFPDLRALPSVPDQVFIALDTEPAMAACEEAISLGVPLVSILANGFAEAGPEGQAREDALRRLVRGTGTRVLGPNSLGIVRSSNRFVCTANAAFATQDLPTGHISVISQSGSAIGTFFSRGRARGIGFANLISVGNEADLSVGQIGQLLVEDVETEVFILFLESFKHTEDLEAFAQAADRAAKSVLVYKLGRSSVGAKLAVSHTGALVSSDDAADAYLRELGFHRVDIFEAVFEGAALFSKRWQVPSTAGPRVAVVATTGGGGALVADRLGLKGIAIAAPSQEVRRRIAATGVVVRDGPLIDLTLAGTRPDVMRGAIEALLDDSSCDAVVAVIGSSSEHFPDLAVKPVLDVVAERKGLLKPLVVFALPHAEGALTLLSQAGIAAFRTPEACADAMAARLRSRHLRLEPHKSFVRTASTSAALEKLATRASEREAIGVFGMAQVPVVNHSFVPLDRVDQVEVSLAGLTYPLVVKVSSPDLPHKSECGGIRMNIVSVDAVRAAIEDIRDSVTTASPAARIDGFLIQEQREGVQEVILGLRRDPAVGPLVTLGVGGVFAELHADVTLRRAPVSVDEAAGMIESVHGLAIARGYRGRPKGDLEALAKTVAAFSQLGAYEQIREAEINPVMVGRNGHGVWAVDGLLVLEKKPPNG